MKRGRKPKNYNSNQGNENMELKTETTNPITIQNLPDDVKAELKAELKTLPDLSRWHNATNPICFSTSKNEEMFIPELSQDMENVYLLKVRHIQPTINYNTNIWEEYGYTLADGVDAVIKTGVKYNEIFKRSFIVQTPPHLSICNKIEVKGACEYQRELCITIRANQKYTLRQGDVIAHLIFV